jgi:NADPH:quinone reductase
VMQALSFSQLGGPEVLELVDVPRPLPGPGRVLVHNHAVGVNYLETLIRRGRIPATLKYSLPFILGQEGAGVVVALGRGVTAPAVGTRVLWMDQPFDAHGYAEYSVVRANNAIPIADNVPFEDAAAVPVVYSTARNQILNYYGRAEPGQWALVRNAAGGAGTAMVETARAAGMRVIAVASSQKLAFARSRGATETIDYKSEDVSQRVRDITGGSGVALALNSIGGATLLEDLCLLAPCGHLILYGLIAGMPTGDLWTAMTQRITEALTISVASIDAYMHHNPTGFRQILEQIAADLAAGSVKPPIFETLSLAQGSRAHTLLESGATTGKLVLTLDQTHS